MSEGLYTEKGSKFIGYAVPCYSEEEAKSYLAEWRKLHHKARHLCYAWRFGIDKIVFRANDDGEPSNSAGTPVLGQIQSFDLTNVLIGVVRYFGGTKLGVGGLIHAYRTAAREAVIAGQILEKKVSEHVSLQFGYAEMPEIMAFVKHHQIGISRQEFGDTCLLEIGLPLDRSAEWQESLSRNAQIRKLGIY